jgi:hypothetical protein
VETDDRSGTVDFDASPDHRVQSVFALGGLPRVLLLAFLPHLVRQLFPQFPHDFDLFFQFDLFVQSKKRPGRLAARPLSVGLLDPDFSFGISAPDSGLGLFEVLLAWILLSGLWLGLAGFNLVRRLGLFRRFQIDGAHLAPAILFEIVGHALVFVEPGQARTLHRTDVNERVASAAFGLDESITLGCVEKFYGADWHIDFLP